MVGVGHVTQQLLARQIGEVELRRVGAEELIARGVDHVLGHREPVAIKVRVFDPQQLGERRVAGPLQDAVLVVIAHVLGPEAVSLRMMPNGRFDVEHVDHDGDDRLHARVHGGGHPGGPAAFGRAGDDELLDLDAAPFVARQQFLNAVHGPDDALDHRQPSRPGLVAGLEVLVPRVADQVIFLARLAIAVEHERLIRHHAQLGDDRASRLSDLCRHLVSAFRHRPIVGTAGDHQERRPMRDFLRHDDGQPMLPDRAVHVGLGAPGLRFQMHHERPRRIAFDGLGDAPGIGVVFLLHIPVERRLLRQGHGRGQNKVGQYGERHRSPRG